MKKLCLTAITLYQRHLSPLKGFSCAYRICTGGDSCSAFGYRAIERHGIRIGLALLRRRLNECSRQHRLHIQSCRQNVDFAKPVNFQAGHCDGCDLGPSDSCDTCDLGTCACDIFDACDWFLPDVGTRERSKKKRGEVTIEANSKFNRDTKPRRPS
ncbi:membrane protein insertion efficiency factor YidD [Paraherbaspirillum soli]|uniref:Membrane protein insertion efficiency factor YidD n=1 Tax=Paraherbaspirillum soli TaxID=631222 RepID=A0ABW0M3S0_9BURK